MDRQTWGFILWGLLFAFLGFIELVAAFGGKRVPFPTLSETVGDLIRVSNGWAAISIVGGFAVLLVHWVFPDAFNPNKKDPPDAKG